MMEWMMKRVFVSVFSLVLLAGLSAQAAPPDNSQTGHKPAAHNAAPAAHSVTAGRPVLRGSANVPQMHVVHPVTVMRHPVTSHYTPSHRVAIHRVTPYHVTSHHVTSHHVITRHVTSSHAAVHVTVGSHGPLKFDPRRYHHNFTAKHRFHAAIYVRPQGWYYRRWSYGQVFPRPFFARDYWITDWQVYGLIAPPEDCEWVRYGSDAVLVDIDTGEILQVIYNFYY
jgi:Ni/Co efflux regulator RcnB